MLPDTRHLFTAWLAPFCLTVLSSRPLLSIHFADMSILVHAALLNMSCRPVSTEYRMTRVNRDFLPPINQDFLFNLGQKFTQPEARQYCQRAGGELLSVSSFVEAADFQAFLSNYQSLAGNIWIGLTSPAGALKGGRNSYRWYSTNSTNTYNDNWGRTCPRPNFCLTEPNPLLSQSSEACVAAAGYQFFAPWFAVDRCDNKYGAACQLGEHTCLWGCGVCLPMPKTRPATDTPLCHSTIITRVEGFGGQSIPGLDSMLDFVGRVSNSSAPVSLLLFPAESATSVSVWHEFWFLATGEHVPICVCALGWPSCQITPKRSCLHTLFTLCVCRMYGGAAAASTFWQRSLYRFL